MKMKHISHHSQCILWTIECNRVMWYAECKRLPRIWNLRSRCSAGAWSCENVQPGAGRKGRIDPRYLANIELCGTIPSVPVVIQLIRICKLPAERCFNPESWISAGISSTPSAWCRIPSPERIGWSIRILPIASDSINGSLSGCGFPKLIVRLPCGSPSIGSTFFPACARPIPKFALVVVLPTPPFRLAMAMKWRPFLMPESLKQKKHPAICYWVPVLESYLIVQIWSDYAKLSSEKSGVWECQYSGKIGRSSYLHLAYFSS